MIKHATPDLPPPEAHAEIERPRAGRRNPISDAVAAERERCAKIAENPGFIQAQDTEWDEGVNYTKRFIAKAIRGMKPNAERQREIAIPSDPSIDEIMAEVGFEMAMDKSDEADRLRARIERLEADHQRIIDMEPATQELTVANDMADVARAALARKEG